MLIKNKFLKLLVFDLVRTTTMNVTDFLLAAQTAVKKFGFHAQRLVSFSKWMNVLKIDTLVIKGLQKV